MGVVTRPDSKYYWLNLERPGQRVIRESSYILVDGPDDKTRAENKALARVIYSTRMGDLARSRHQLPVDRPKITFAKYREWYLANISIHKRNEIRERSMLVQLGKHFDPLDLAAIDLQQAREWRTKRARTVAPATVNRERELLLHLMGTAVPMYLETHPIKTLEALRVPEHDTRLLEPDEELRLLKALNPENTAIVICALDTLQRLSSVADLKRAQDHGDYLTFLNTKTKGGKVPVSTRLRKALDALPKRGAYYFPTYQGVTVGGRRNAVIRMFNEACEQAHIQTGQKEGLTFHCLRHTGASRMLDRGVDIDTVRRIGGWADLDVLRRYLHPTDEASRRAVEVVSAAGHARAIHGNRKTRKKTRKKR